MAIITPEIVKQVALLARLRLEGQTLTQAAAQLDEILQYVQQLCAVNTTGVPPTSHVLALTNVMRADEPQPSLSQQAVVSLAPAAHPPFIKVPKVIES